MESNQQSSRRAARLQRVELAIAYADAEDHVADGLLLPVLPSVAAAVAGGLFPRAVPALADRADPRTRVSSPPGAGMKKPFRRRARKGSVLIHRCARRYRAPSPSEPVARYGDPHGNRLAWPRPFASERLGASQAITIGCIRFIITYSTPGRGGGTRTPVDAVLETAALAAELHLVKTKKPPRSSRGGLPIWGLSSVVSRRRQAHLTAPVSTRQSAPRPILAAVFGE